MLTGQEKSPPPACLLFSAVKLRAECRQIGATKSLSGFFCMCYKGIKLAPGAWTGLSSVLKDLRMGGGKQTSLRQGAVDKYREQKAAGCCQLTVSSFVAVWQIEKDLLRTMPSNACFSNMNSIGVPRLRRILRGLAWLYPEIGYCQGTGMVSCSPGGLAVGSFCLWQLCRA